MVNAERGEHFVSLSGKSLLRGTSLAEAFLGVESGAGAAVETTHDLALQRLRQRAGVALGIGASTLVVFVVMGIFAIMVIAGKLGQQDEEIYTLNKRHDGLLADLMRDKLKTREMDLEKRNALENQLSKKARDLEDEKARLAKEKDVLRGQRAAIEADKATIAKQQEQLKSMVKKDKQLIDNVLSRGKVHVDLDKQLFKILEPIAFKKIVVKESMKHAPPAEFEDADAATEVLKDLAEIIRILIEGKTSSPRLLIEGHTAGGAKAVSDIGFEIACARAEKVTKTLVSLGVEADRLESKGKPGLLGDNNFDTKIVTLSWEK